MNANECGLAVGEVTNGEGEVFNAVERRLERMACELPPLGRHVRLCNAPDQLLVATAIADQVSNRDHHQTVLGSKLREFGNSRHLNLVGRDDFAQQPCWLETSEHGQVDRRFGMAGALQYTTSPCFERKDVARPCEVVWFGADIDQRLDRGRAITCTDAGRRAVLVVHTDEECRLHALGVLNDHWVEPEFTGAFARDRSAEKARCVVQKERHLFGCGELSGHDQVALVLTVLVINHDDNLAVANRFDGFINCVECRVK